MDILQKLSPAETKLILNPYSAKIKELLQLTFMDLLLKQVLKVEIVEEVVHTWKQVSKGPKLDGYKPRAHETVFTNTFKESPDIVLTAYETVKMVKSEITSAKAFKWDYLIEPSLLQYFKPRPSLRLIDALTEIRLNDSGLKLQKDLSSFFNKYNAKVRGKTLTVEETRMLYNSIGSNFLLVEGFASSYIKEIFNRTDQSSGKNEKIDSASLSDPLLFDSGHSSEEKSFDFPAIPILNGILVFEMLQQIEAISESVSEIFRSSFDSSDNSSWFGGDSDGWFGGESNSDDSGGDSGCSGCGGCGGD